MQSTDLAVRILEQVPVPVWVVGGDGAVAFANTAAARALGYRSASTLWGAPGHDTVHHHRPDGSGYPVAECPLLRPGPGGPPEAVEDQWFIRRDGSLFPIAWTAVPIELQDGAGTVLTFQDVALRRVRQEEEQAHRWVRPGLASPAVRSPTTRAVLIEEVKRFVATHAADPQLTPSRVADHHHVSLRALQTLLAAHGDTPAQAIRQARLDRACRFLLDGLPVGVAARRSGFGDTGTFTRAFRRAFGTTPGAYTAQL